MEIAKGFGAGWIQIDVSERDFSGFENWNNPEEFSENVSLKDLNFYLEVHLMVKEPMDIAERWLETGADRIIIHVESDFDIEEVSSLCGKYGAELMLSLLPGTPIEKVLPYLKETNLVQLLAVEAGPSGQGFQDGIVSKIGSLLEASPGVIIEVDGGVDERIAKKLRDEGVNMAAVGSYIFESSNPEERYKILEEAAK